MSMNLVRKNLILFSAYLFLVDVIWLRMITSLFASVLISIPSTLTNFIKAEGFKTFVSNYLVYTKPVGFIIYVILIFAFAYFYTFMQINPKELSNNLKNNGGYIKSNQYDHCYKGKDSFDFFHSYLTLLRLCIKRI